MTSVHDVWEPLKQAFWASRDVIISSQICVLKFQRFFTLGDGCWLPMLIRPEMDLYEVHEIANSAHVFASVMSALLCVVFLMTGRRGEVPCAGTFSLGGDAYA